MKCLLVECENEVKDTRWPGCSRAHTWLITQRKATMEAAFNAQKNREDMEWYNQCVDSNPKLNWAKPPRMDFTVEEAIAYGTKKNYETFMAELKR